MFFWRIISLKSMVERGCPKIPRRILLLENFASFVMRELVKHKYTRGIFPEHPRVLLYDKDRPGELSGYMYNLAYARAMFQAVMYNGG